MKRQKRRFRHQISLYRIESMKMRQFRLHSRLLRSDVTAFLRSKMYSGVPKLSKSFSTFIRSEKPVASNVFLASNVMNYSLSQFQQACEVELLTLPFLDTNPLAHVCSKAAALGKQHSPPSPYSIMNKFISPICYTSNQYFYM